MIEPRKLGTVRNSFDAGVRFTTTVGILGLVFFSSPEAHAGQNSVSGFNKAERTSFSSVLESQRGSEKFIEVSQSTSGSKLLVRKGTTYHVDVENLETDCVILEERSVLIVPSSFTDFTLRTGHFIVESGAQIIARGKRGTSGNRGRNGDSGSSCKNGENGAPGEDGLNGKSGISIKIFADKFFLAGRLAIDTSGGIGGNGGRGGNGGVGGDANNPVGCGGGNGGTGGAGGVAGDGGNGGALSIRYGHAYSMDYDPINLSEAVMHIARPGSGGSPGKGGIGERGGSSIPRKSLPGGSRGIDGSPGQAGEPGKLGETSIVQGLLGK